MKKKIILSILLSSLMVCACESKEDSSSNSKNSIVNISSSTVTTSSSSYSEVVLPVAAVDFILYVNEIVIDEYAGIAIEEAWDMYDALGNDWDYPQVSEAYYKLIYLEEMYNEYIELYYEALDFIEKVEQIPYLLSLDDERYIVEAENKYENLSDEEKEILGVSEAYKRLQKAREDFDNLYLQSIIDQRQEIIDEFLKIVSDLPNVDDMTIHDIDALNDAFEAYENLEEDIQKENLVIDAYNKLLELQTKYEELLDVRIILDANGGECDISYIDLTALDPIGDLPTPTKDNYRFMGWYTSAEGGEKVTSSTVIEEDGTIYARWKEILNLTITLDANGGTCNESTRNITNVQAIGSLPTPTLKGYIFLGWYTAIDGGEKVTSSTIFEESTTIYARWKEILNLTITLDANGGTCNESTKNITNEQAIGSLPIPTLEGYRFVGWYTAIDGGEKVTSSTIFEESTTIYAHWEDENIPIYGISTIKYQGNQIYFSLSWNDDAYDIIEFTSISNIYTVDMSASETASISNPNIDNTNNKTNDTYVVTGNGHFASGDSHVTDGTIVNFTLTVLAANELSYNIYVEFEAFGNTGNGVSRTPKTVKVTQVA